MGDILTMYRPMIEKLDSIKLDKHAVLDLLLFGVVGPDRTMIEGVPSLFLSKDCEYLKSAPPDFSENAINSIVHWFRTNIPRMQEESPLGSLRLSGGLDSRIIASCFLPEQRRSIEAQIVTVPWLEFGADADVQMALQVANRLGLKSKIIENREEFVGYLKRSSPEQVSWSGIFGGEFLGGLSYQVFPQNLAETSCLSGHPLVRERVEAMNEFFFAFGRRAATLFLMANSFRSSIYDSERYSWSYPWRLKTGVRSPFCSSDLIELILAIPEKDYAGYRAYNHIYRALGAEVYDLPLCSPITKFHKDLRSSNEFQNPKAVNRTPQDTSPSEIRSEVLNMLSDLYDVDFSNVDSTLKTRIKNLQYFIDDIHMG